MDRKFSLTVVAATVLLVSNGAHAQSVGGITPATASPAQSARSLIAQFRATTGATVDVADGLDLDRPVAVPPGLFGSRQHLMDNIAGAINAEWHKTWVVTSVSPTKPYADADYLRGVADQAGTVSFDATSLPAAQAIRTVAKADNADVQIVGPLPTPTVTLAMSDLGVADAIAGVSRATGTSWSLTYTLALRTASTRATVSDDSPRLFHIRQADRLQRALANQEAPIMVHFQYPSTGPDPRVMDQGVADNGANTYFGPTVTTPGSPLSPLGAYSSGLSGDYGPVGIYALGNGFGGPLVTSVPTIGNTVTPSLTPVAVQQSGVTVINQQPTITTLSP